MFKDLKITRPSQKEVKRHLKLWYSFENYALQENSLTKLFTKTYPLNNNFSDVLIKASALNDLYNTNIYSTFTVAKHILTLKIDKDIRKGNLVIVNKIADIKINSKKRINFYSFATKYCSHHKPMIYPIYDSYVGKTLIYFKKKDNFYNFSQRDLKTYATYKNILINFKKHYGLEAFNLRQIDKYLWQVGKKYFSKKY